MKLKVFLHLGALAVAALLFSQLTALRPLAQTRGIKDEITNKPATATNPAGPRRYYALVIGNNAYQALPKLKTAEGDAQAVADILRDQYGFQPTLLLNATRQQIIAALNGYRRELDENANLLIYYAGHGYNDTEVDKAYWLPVDARLDDNANWISADDITTDTKGIHAHHMLIISDSCYSGTIVRDADPTIATPAEHERYLQKMDEGKSRTLMASGGDEPVADAGGNGHSIFAAALLRGMGQMDKPQFTAGEVFRDYVVESVAGSAEQTPEYSPLRNSGHEAGDFVFTRTGDAKPAVQAQTQAGAPMPNTATPRPAPQLAQPPVAQPSKTSTTTQAPTKPSGRGLALGTPQTVAESLPAGLTAEQYEETAVRAADAHQWALSEAALRAALRLPASKPVDHANLGLVLANQQKYTEAETEARTGVRLRPNLAFTHARLAYVLIKEQKLTEAEAERREALRIEPNAKAHSLLAASLLKQSKWSEAETEARAAVGMAAQNALYHNQLGIALREQKRLTEAIAEFREAVRLAPANTEYLINLNRALAAQKRQ
ncbi:MAG: caspase family protein [Pyrinomonadaceae bacterium]